jgi:hypothetical protein
VEAEKELAFRVPQQGLLTQLRNFNSGFSTSDFNATVYAIKLWWLVQAKCLKMEWINESA